MPEFSGKFFKTFQTVAAYENALKRHGQYVRWTKAILCPCLDPMTNQPNVNCNLCQGRGRIYSVPGPFSIQWENARHDNYGRIYPKASTYIQGTMTVYHQDGIVSLAAAQPADNSYVQMASPWPQIWQRIHVKYSCTPQLTVRDENCAVVLPNVLMASACDTNITGDSIKPAGIYPGSISLVTRVYNRTRGEYYQVVKCEKNFIELLAMTNYQTGDVLEVDYNYVAPYQFLVSGVSPKMRYNQAYILDEASALLVTPYYHKVGKDDLITALSQQHYGEAIIDPTNNQTQVDTITNYYDLATLIKVVDVNGVEYSTTTDIRLVGRNKLVWITQKPAVNYTVQFTYHPTYIALKEFPSMRAAENKEFVNRMNLMQYDQLSGNRSF